MWNGKGKKESMMISRLAQVTGCIAGLYNAIKKNKKQKKKKKKNKKQTKKNMEIGVGRSSLAENRLYLGWLLDSEVEIS